MGYRLDFGPVLDAIPDKLTDILQSAGQLGVTLCLIDAPSKLDGIAMSAIRAADMIICPTLPDLFNLGSLSDTVRLLEAGGKLAVTVGVVNNVDEGNTAAARVGQAVAAIEGLKMTACPVVVHHRPQFQTAALDGKGVTEVGKAKKAADEVRKLWAYLDEHSKPKKQPSAGGKKAKARKLRRPRDDQEAAKEWNPRQDRERDKGMGYGAIG